MRLADILAMAFAALWRHKARTVLTVLGVSIGAFTLVTSLAVGQGVEAALLKMFRENDRLRKIQVFQSYEAEENEAPPEVLLAKGPMSDAKRTRLRKVLLRRWQNLRSTRPKPLLTRPKLDEIARMPHVRTVVPEIFLSLEATFGDRSRDVFAMAAQPGAKSLRSRIVAGSDLSPDGPTALIHEGLLYAWGITDDDAVRAVIGRPVRLILRINRRSPNSILSFLTGGALDFSAEEGGALDRALKRLPDALDTIDMPEPERVALKKSLKLLPIGPPARPEATYTEEFTIAGVLREWDESDEPPGQVDWAGSIKNADLILSLHAAEAFSMRPPEAAEIGFDQAVVTVDREENVMDVHKMLKATGLRVASLAEIIGQVRTNVVLLSFVTAFVAVVSLLVAAIGIANTMVMSVMERTREIGVMKAVGARDRDVRNLFLVEGALIGMVGGAFGLLMAWAASFPGDAVARSIMEEQAKAPTGQSLFLFPAWITLGVPAAAAVVTTLAALYPASRAARLDPIASLRHD